MSDIEAVRIASSKYPISNSVLDELVGTWAGGKARYYFDGRSLIAINDVLGVDRARMGGFDKTPDRIFPAGTVVFRLSELSSEGLVGYWLFEDQIWGRVVGELVHEGFLNLRPRGISGVYGGLGIGLHLESKRNLIVKNLVEATSEIAFSEQQKQVLNYILRIADNNSKMTDGQQLSILLAILDQVAIKVGERGQIFEMLNYSRNTKQGAMISRDEVRRYESGWKGPVPSKEKAFHTIGISNPDLVEKYTHPDGREAVFILSSEDSWVPLKDDINDATYNYVVSGSKPGLTDEYQHLVLDVVPWIIWGVSKTDRTTISQRMQAFRSSDQMEKARLFLNPIDSVSGFAERSGLGTLGTMLQSDTKVAE